MVIEQTLCRITKEGMVLLKLASRGIGEGKWNFPGGTMEPSETKLECVVREVKEETGLKIENPKEIATMNFHVEGTGLFRIVYLFTSNTFSGNEQVSDEGELEWFDISRLPMDRMWPADRYWVPWMMDGKPFKANFYYDKEKKRVLKFDVEFLAE